MIQIIFCDGFKRLVAAVGMIITVIPYFKVLCSDFAGLSVYGTFINEISAGAVVTIV